MSRPSSTALLHAAAVVSLLFFLGHLSGYPWTPGETSQAEAVVAQMRSVQFETLGAQRSYWDFYVGFGLLVSAGLLLVTATLWTLVPLMREQSARVVAPAVCALAFLVVNAVLSQLYFFWLPTALAVLATLLLAAALLRARAEH